MFICRYGEVVAMEELNEGGKKELEERFRSGRKNISESQIASAVRRSRQAIIKMENRGVPASLKNVWDDLLDLYCLIRDSLAGRYKVPYRTITAVAFTLIYFVNPFDMIPDFIPLVGYIDDVFVISLCLTFVGRDLEDYREWKADTIPQDEKI
ncbi:MAG: DUF1232 domain-containing protein [Candidatus Aegiribacteria sp.]|nr:DUF1232 domain-containing protein [Candidatus Aegiribacteria sp.]